MSHYTLTAFHMTLHRIASHMSSYCKIVNQMPEAHKPLPTMSVIYIILSKQNGHESTFIHHYSITCILSALLS